MRLVVKLILAFLVVGLMGVASIAFFASLATETEFMRFIFDEFQDELVDQLETYYQTHQAWQGVEQVMPVGGNPPFEKPRPFNRPAGFITLVDDQGRILIAGRGYHVGETIPFELVETWQPIRSDGEVVGWVIAPREQFERNPAEISFVRRTQRALTTAAIGAATVSLLLGVVLSRTLTRPLRDLTAATRAIAQGDLTYKVRVRSRDEIGELASSFNLMSDELGRAQELRRQMTADIAHELRTPISVILGHVDALEEGVLPASSETFGILREETGRLERLVEDLRTLSRADAGELTLTPRTVHPQTLLEQAIAAHRPLTLERGVTMHIEAVGDIPELNVDPDRMAQVLGNLLNNALRYSPQGGRITLRARSTNGEVELQVEDSGTGLPPEALDRIFDRFYRTDPSRQRESGGSGLGLPIARSILEMHGGRIWAESEPGKGTRIVIRLPVWDAAT